MNYAHLVVDSSCRIGRAQWEQRLPELSSGQREELVARIEHWNALLAREGIKA